MCDSKERPIGLKAFIRNQKTSICFSPYSLNFGEVFSRIINRRNPNPFIDWATSKCQYGKIISLYIKNTSPVATKAVIQCHNTTLNIETGDMKIKNIENEWKKRLLK